MSENTFETVFVNIDDLKIADYNPRQMTKKQVDDLLQSVREFGFVEPIVVNKHSGRENIIVGGHMRVAAAKILGLTTVPVHYVDLPLEQEKELNIRLNKNTGEWDWSKLANFEIDDLKSIGFDDKELEIGFNLFKPEDEGGDARLDKSNKKPITCPECGHEFTP